MRTRMLKLLLGLALLTFSSAAIADEITYHTEFKCDQNNKTFEIAEYKIINGVRRDRKNAYRVPLKGNSLTNQPPNQCTLGLNNLVRIEVKTENSRANLQGQCGSQSGTKQYILTINNAQKILFPSAYTSCMGAISYPRQQKEFRGQDLFPTYLKITDSSILMLEYDFWNDNRKPNDFLYTTTESFLSEK